jgi:L-ascorbate metabolism protein UlaG (beta-lactamase superfamily)
MLIRRLTWAGIEIEIEGATAVIDLLTGSPALTKYAGEPLDRLLAPSARPGTTAVAAVTHLHSDHFDAEALQCALALNAPVLCPPESAESVAAAGLNARSVETWETVSLAGLEFTAVPAVDGLGAPQTSWVVSDGEHRLIHCGDTLWHGHWWTIAERCGSIDLAFLPVNGVVADFDYLQPPSGIPAVMTPEQAAAAAQVLTVRLAAPIHYGTFHRPPHYISLPDPEATFASAAARRGVATLLLQPGSEIDLARSTTH